ncbi:hypothetical protein [Nostoc sphaeroides]|nr:hypothetical protein [Nostoc sphaeroides]
MRYKIISQGVGARHCRAPTSVRHACRETLYIDEYWELGMGE